jgi:hypothetical protein
MLLGRRLERRHIGDQTVGVGAGRKHGADRLGERAEPDRGG